MTNHTSNASRSVSRVVLASAVGAVALGVLRTAPADDTPVRLAQLHRDLEELLDGMIFNIDKDRPVRGTA